MRTKIHWLGVLGMACWFLMGSSVWAHPGRTDSSGCHTCRTNCAKWGLSNGEYHCHGGGDSSPSRPEPSQPSRPNPISPFFPKTTPTPIFTPTPIPTPGPTPTPWPTPTSTPAPERPIPSNGKCVVKGIVLAEKLYMLPGHIYYNTFEVYKKDRARWFCSESEAQQAGFRKWVVAAFIPRTPRPRQYRCLIKGKVLKPPINTKVYLLYSHSLYSTVQIDEERGDQWFCSEAEAQKAGFAKLLDKQPNNQKP